jgi:hypothetical protein
MHLSTRHEFLLEIESMGVAFHPRKNAR